jgi:hypothetical protein
MEIRKIFFDKDNIYVQLDSGHIIGNPLIWFERLKNASPEEREKFEIGPTKESIHWEQLNEDISLESLFDFKRELTYAKV